MALSEDLVSQFVKVTNDESDKPKETTVYGTIRGERDGVMWVKLDGADNDQLTPVETTVDVKDGDRVTILIKNHTATVTGNTSAPAARNETVQELDGKVEGVSKVVADTVETVNLKADKAEIDTLVANSATIKDLKAENAEIKNLKADKAEIDTLVANSATIKDLKADVGKIDTLIFGSASGDTIHTDFSNSVIAQVGDAQIKDAMIQNLSAGKITAGDIITNNVRVTSEDGSLVIADETMQISDGNRVRVQIGKDASNDYSINIWDAEGKLMFSQGGIEENAIKKAIIRNDMVSDNANISASKLDINSLFEEINGSEKTIKSTKIFLDDEGQTLDVVFKTLTTDTDGLKETVSSQGTTLSIVQGQINSKIWEQDITTAVDGAKTEMNTKYSTLEQNLEGFKTTVHNTYTTKDEVSESIATAKSSIEQSAERVAISAATTTVDAALGDYYTKEQTESRIEVIKDSITSTVATKEDISTLTQTAEGLRFDLNSAIDDAEEALSTANTAKSTADSAASAASKAQTTANTASSAASTAQTTANNAASAASSAATAASTAQSTANTAKSTADTAKSTADSAKTAASTAQSTANTARTEASNAAKTATDYLTVTTSGLEVGYSGTNSNVLIKSTGIDIRNGTTVLSTFGSTSARIGKSTSTNVYIDSDSVDIMKNGTTLATFAANKVELGKNSTTAVIDLCNGSATISATDENGTSWDGIGIEAANVSLATERNSKSLWSYFRGVSKDADANNATPHSEAIMHSKNASTASAYARTFASDDGSRYAHVRMHAEGYGTSLSSGWLQRELEVRYDNIIARGGKGSLTDEGIIRPWAVTLWTGGTGYYMTASQTATLAETITSQPLGIVLVFRECNTSGGMMTAGFHTYFVPKQVITDTNDGGHGHIISWNHMGRAVYKYLYISNAKIVGHAHNDNGNTVGSPSNITSTNNRAVLWKVYGV